MECEAGYIHMFYKAAIEFFPAFALLPAQLFFIQYSGIVYY